MFYEKLAQDPFTEEKLRKGDTTARQRVSSLWWFRTQKWFALMAIPLSRAEGDQKIGKNGPKSGKNGEKPHQFERPCTIV